MCAYATLERIECDTTTTTSAMITQVVHTIHEWIFREQDWQRLSKTAEWDSDASILGTFGVGAYNMFSIIEEPVIFSRDCVLLFHWKGDSLYTQVTARYVSAELTTYSLDPRIRSTPSILYEDPTIVGPVKSHRVIAITPPQMLKVSSYNVWYHAKLVL